MLSCLFSPPSHISISSKLLQKDTAEIQSAVMQFHCTPCKRDFGDKQALNKHLRHASAHISVVDCQPCKKSFVNQDALDQHLRDSPAHKITFPCEPCNRSFVNQDALDQHLRDAPAHGAPTFDCELCNRSFVHQEALDSHVQTARIHQRRVNTPLDNFFRSYPDFAYDPSLPPAMSYASLQKHKRWRRWQSESNEAWESYQNALNAELEMWYGAEDDLTAWHALCRAIGISPPPATCERCEQVKRCMEKEFIQC